MEKMLYNFYDQFHLYFVIKYVVKHRYQKNFLYKISIDQFLVTLFKNVFLIRLLPYKTLTKFIDSPIDIKP